MRDHIDLGDFMQPDSEHGRIYKPSRAAVRRLRKLMAQRGPSRRRADHGRGGIVTNLQATYARRVDAIAAKNRKYSDEEIRAAYGHYQRGLSVAAVAEVTGICDKTLRRRWKLLGAPITAVVADRKWEPGE